MRVSKKLILGSIGFVVACGDGAGTALQLALSDAGDVLADAAQLLQDAGRQADAGHAQAQGDAGGAGQGGPVTTDVPCSTTADDPGATYYYAVKEVELASIRQVWVCQPAKPTECEGGADVCATVTDIECSGAVYNYARGKLYVTCGQSAMGGVSPWAVARIVTQ